jgi:hypothetical protein
VPATSVTPASNAVGQNSLAARIRPGVAVMAAISRQVPSCRSTLITPCAAAAIVNGSSHCTANDKSKSPPAGARGFSSGGSSSLR